MTTTEIKHYQQMWNALRRITKYQSVERILRSSQKDWGLDSSEALEYAYENVIGEAKAGLRGVRRVKERTEAQ